MSATTLSLPTSTGRRSAPRLLRRARTWIAARLHEAQQTSHAAVEARRELAIEFSELSRGYPVGRSSARWY